ncbi:MAG: serine protease [Ignavibacteria bacterium]|nr:MAG: serine protease [Ignavibacteria bacterium]
MPTWGEILAELNAVQQSTGQLPYDSVRRKYLKALHQHTRRQTILYATKWTQTGTGTIEPAAVSITDEDIQGFMEVIYGLKEKSLDLILHSPGGSAEAAEGIVTYLRSKFDDIRVIVPQAAMSAATMLACAANQIVMGKHSFLGPIDPQFILQTPIGVQAVPAHAILDQFKQAQNDCKNPQLLSSWLPILSQYGPGLLVQCKNAIDLSQELVKNWLHTYMFQGKTRNPSTRIAKKLAAHRDFKSHGRHIGIQQAISLGLVVEALENNHTLQGTALSVYHATMHTLAATNAVKIIENHLGTPPIHPPAQP